MDLHSIFDAVVAGLVGFIGKIGYFGIFVGMFLESTIFPMPSELVMIPSGMAASQGVFNIYLVILFGVTGNVFGAIFSYYLAASLGRAILFNVGKYFFLKPATIIKIESFFNKHGAISVFVGRIIPGVRHLIALPAGVARMDIKKFILYTFLGSFVWTTILAVLGFYIGKNQDLIKQYLQIIILSGVSFCLLLIVIYSVFYKRKIKKITNV